MGTFALGILCPPRLLLVARRAGPRESQGWEVVGCTDRVGHGRDAGVPLLVTQGFKSCPLSTGMSASPLSSLTAYKQCLPG